MLRGYQRVGFEQSPREAIFVWGGADIGVGITPRCSWNVTLGLRKKKPSGGVAKIHIFFTSHFQDSHLGTIPCFLVQENELWRDSVKLLTETFLGVLLWESIFFQFLGTVNWWLLFVWGGRNLCGKRGMGIWKTLEFWWGFFHFQGPNTSELRFFLGPIWWIIAAYWGQNSEEEIRFQPVSIYVGCSCCWCWAFNPLQPPGRVLSGLNFFWTWYLGWGHGHTVDVWNLVSTSWVW